MPLIKEGLKAVKALSAEGIKTNVTVTFSPLQAMIAAKCGATYISPFVGRLDAAGHFGMELVRQIRTIYDNYGFETEIIVAAVRHPTARPGGGALRGRRLHRGPRGAEPALRSSVDRPRRWRCS